MNEFKNNIKGLNVEFTILPEITPLKEHYNFLTSEQEKKLLKEKLWFTAKFIGLYNGKQIAFFYSGCNLYSNIESYKESVNYKFDLLSLQNEINKYFNK